MKNRTLAIIIAILAAYFLITSAAPNILLIPLLFTFGLALPLLYANTVLVYALAAAPALMLLNSTPRDWRWIALASLLVPAVAVGLPLATEALIAQNMQRHLAGDFSGSFAETPRLIEQVGDAQYYSGPAEPLKSAACDPQCQRLLLSRRVEIVRVKREPTDRFTRAGELDYVIEHRDVCPDAFAKGETVLPETKDAMVSGACFVSRKPGLEPMLARIEIRNSRLPPPQDIGSMQVLTISTPSSAGWSPKLQRTQVKFSHWSAPLFLFFEPCNGVCIGPAAFARSERTVNRFDVDTLVLRTLGIDDQRPIDRLGPVGRVAAMLDRGGGELSSDHVQLVVDWVESLRCGEGKCPSIAGRDAEVLLRLVQDKRFNGFRIMDDVIARSRDVVADHLDMFLGLMEVRDANSAFSNSVGMDFPRLDDKDLRTRGARILSLIMNNDWKREQGIATVSGRLGIDTTQLISERLKWLEASKAAAVAACTADATIGERLVPAMLDYLRARPISNDAPDYAAIYVSKGLARFGHFEEAKQILLDRYPKLHPSYLPPQSVAGVVPDISICRL